MNESITKLLKNLKDVPSMPNIVIKALNIVKDPNSGIKDLGDIICYDQALSITVLKLVNSAYYGFAQQISSITRALTLLGMNKAKNIIIAAAMKPMFSAAQNKELWLHAITTAVGCEYLSNHLQIMDSDEAFIIGFMHDIGKLITNLQDETLLEKINELVADGSNIIEAENAFFGTNHSEIGAELSKKWQLPILLTNTIKYHHCPNESSVPLECSLVYTIDTLVQKNFNPDNINKNYLDILNINLDEPRILRESILNRAGILINNLS